jgi:hypothetical protein
VLEEIVEANIIRTITIYVGPEVLEAVTTKNTAFWAVMQCSSDTVQRFGGTSTPF